jgi:hypothetical protein
MPTYQRFEDLPVWQEAIRLAERCEDFIELAEKHITWSKRDQLDRASLSVSNNIAEGFERGTTNELLAFLYIVLGTGGAVDALFLRTPSAARSFQISNFRFEIHRRELFSATPSGRTRSKIQTSPARVISTISPARTIRNDKPASPARHISNNSCTTPPARSPLARWQTAGLKFQIPDLKIQN